MCGRFDILEEASVAVVRFVETTLDQYQDREFRLQVRGALPHPRNLIREPRDGIA